MDKSEYVVKRAIIMAAGIGKRMQPLSLSVPKPLIKVNGIRMIDTVVNGLAANGINEIYVVVGYLKEQFEEWVKQYPYIVLIDNPFYEVCNNIASLYVAREHLEDCIILDADQIICNEKILEKSFRISGYNAVWTDENTDEWLLDVKDGIVQSCSRTGGNHGWQLFSVSRWTAEDGSKLKGFLEKEFEGGNDQIYWDDVAMFEHFQSFNLGIKQMEKGDIIEVDTLEELAAIDESYKKYL